MTPLRKTAPAGAHPASRRASGELEAAILRALWDAGRPLNATEVRDALNSTLGTAQHAALAYTTVVTILTRLKDKGALQRERDGRAYRYTPTADLAGLAARRMTALLDAAKDRDTVLVRFVTALSSHDEELVRALLEQHLPTQVTTG